VEKGPCNQQPYPTVTSPYHGRAPRACEGLHDCRANIVKVAPVRAAE